MHKSLCILVIIATTTLLSADVTPGKWKKEWKDILEEYAEAIGKTKDKDFEKNLKNKKVDDDCEKIEDLLKDLDKKFKNKDKNPKIYKRDIMPSHRELGGLYIKMHMQIGKYIKKMSKIFNKKKRKTEMAALLELSKDFEKIKKSVKKSFDKKPPSQKKQKLEELEEERDEALKKIAKLKQKLEDDDSDDRVAKTQEKLEDYIDDVREKLTALHDLYDNKDSSKNSIALMNSQLGTTKSGLDGADRDALLQKMTQIEKYLSGFMQSYLNDLNREVRE